MSGASLYLKFLVKKGHNSKTIAFRVSKFGIDTFNTFWVKGYIKDLHVASNNDGALAITIMRIAWLFLRNRQTKNMLHIYIHLTLTSYCTWVLHSVRIKHCKTGCFSVQILCFFCWNFHTCIEHIQSLIMKIRYFSMIINTMQLIILQFCRLSDIALYNLRNEIFQEFTIITRANKKNMLQVKNGQDFASPEYTVITSTISCHYKNKPS